MFRSIKLSSNISLSTIFSGIFSWSLLHFGEAAIFSIVLLGQLPLVKFNPGLNGEVNTDCFDDFAIAICVAVVDVVFIVVQLFCGFGGNEMAALSCWV